MWSTLLSKTSNRGKGGEGWRAEAVVGESRLDEKESITCTSVIMIANVCTFVQECVHVMHYANALWFYTPPTMSVCGYLKNMVSTDKT